jgi:hypothetical protein
VTFASFVLFATKVFALIGALSVAFCAVIGAIVLVHLWIKR